MVILGLLGGTGSFLIFWWSTVIFEIPLNNENVSPKFEVIFGGAWSFFKLWWSMVVSQILVEHGHFSNFGGTRSFLFLGGAWSGL